MASQLIEPYIPSYIYITITRTYYVHIFLNDEEIIKPICTSINERKNYLDLLHTAYKKDIFQDYPRSKLLLVKIGPVPLQGSIKPEHWYIVHNHEMHVASSHLWAGVCYYLNQDEQDSRRNSRDGDKDYSRRQDCCSDNSHDSRDRRDLPNSRDRRDLNSRDRRDSENRRHRTKHVPVLNKLPPFKPPTFIAPERQKCYECGVYGHHAENCHKN